MINKTQLNKFRSIIEKNKLFLDGITPALTIDTNKKYSVSVSMTILMEYYSLNQLEAYNSITDDGDDNKIDAFYFSDDENEISELVVVQSKYKQNDGETNSISLDEMISCMNNCIKIINGENFAISNSKLANKISAFRELQLNNGLPSFNIKLFFATNGLIHEPFKTSTDLNRCYDFNITPIFVDATSFGHSSSIEFGELLVNTKDPADKTDSIFSFENEHYSGRVVSCSIDELMKFYKSTGERLLLNSNVRYLIKNSTINKEIRNSFIKDPSRFCYLNNGITIISSNFDIVPTGLPTSKVQLTKPSVVNGGQTIATLYNLYTTKYAEYETQFKTAKILLRIYKAPSEYSIKIAQATNSQNPINIVDLKSNDTAQEVAKKYLAKFGIGLLTKLGEDITYYNDTITNENILQVYASLYKDDPAKAKTSKAATFKLYYDEVFSDSIDELMCKKLLRCYEISKFLNEITTKDSVVIMYVFKLNWTFAKRVFS